MSRKNKGWVKEPVRHSLASKGIKTVSITKTQRKKVAKALNPLLQKRYITGYSIVEKPDTIKNKDMQVRYSHNVIKRHRNVIEAELKSMGLEYEILPKEKYTKSGRKNEYQIVVKAKPDDVYEFTRFLKRRATDFNEIIDFLDTHLNPAETSLNSIELNEARIVPDIRVRNKGKEKDFTKATRISKKLDDDTELVIISLRPMNIKKVKNALKGEQVTKVLIQDFAPQRHSQKNFILENTQQK